MLSTIHILDYLVFPTALGCSLSLGNFYRLFKFTNIFFSSGESTSKPFKGNLYLCYYGFSFVIPSLDFFFKVLISAKITIWSCMLSIFSMKALNMLTVIIKSSDIPRLVAYLSLVWITAYFLVRVLLCLAFLYSS